MNPLSNVRFIKELNEREVNLGISDNASWHNQYKDSAWIFVGGLAYDLTEGDVLCVFSQYGEIVNVNLIRDKATGKSKGYCFICYEDQRSSVLAVDNFNGIKLSNRTIRVDHVASYKVPKDFPDTDEITKRLRDEGCAPAVVKKNSEPDVIEIIKNESNENTETDRRIRPKKSQGGNEEQVDVAVKRERHDPEYDKYVHDSERRSSHKSRQSHSSNDRSRYRPKKSHTSRRSRSRSRSKSRSRSPRHRNKHSRRSPPHSKSRSRR